jgi:hypothetical protein
MRNAHQYCNLWNLSSSVPVFLGIQAKGVQMSRSNDTSEDESTPREFAAHELSSHHEVPHVGDIQDSVSHEFAANQFGQIERNEQPFVASAAGKTWGITGMVLATLFVIAIMVVGFQAERTLNFFAPNKPVPTSGFVIDQPANTNYAAPAYPTVFVQKSADPSQAPSPLPETPAKTK